MSYRQLAVKGFSWHYFFKLSASLISLGKIMILARILDPKDFGLFSLTLIALGITESFTETGINTTIMQSRHSINYYLNTAWVISILRGLVIAILVMILGLIMNKFYSEKELLFLIALASLIPIARGFINPAITKFYKDLNFFKDTTYRLSLSLISSILSVGLAFWLRSAYALILAMFLAALIEVLITFICLKERPQFEFKLNRAKDIFQNARGLSVSAFFNYLNENLDNFLIGKLTSTRLLGIYQNAYTLSHKSYELAQSVHHSTFPIFLRIKHKPEQLKKSYLKVALTTLALITLVSLPLFIAPTFFIKLILGNKWLEVIPLLRILLLASLFQSFSTISYSVFLARKTYFIMNIHLISTVLVLILAMIYLTNQYGLIGGVTAVLISRAITTPILIWGLK